MPTRKLRDLLALTKPRITALVILSGAAGFLIGAGPASKEPAALIATLVGIGLVAGGTSALNQLLEWRTDARMERTKRRPLPAGRLRVGEAAVFAGVVCLAGILVLAVLVNLLTAALATLALVGYAGIYTPLKKVTSLSTLVGAVPGALPVMGGWTAATGELGAGAWALFGILFFWQLPHFLALAWLYRSDYRAGNLRMLGASGGDGPRGRMQSVLYAAALLPASLLPLLLGLGGVAYGVAALGLTTLYLTASVRFAVGGEARGARSLFRVSLLYLPLLMLVLTLDRPSSADVTSPAAPAAIDAGGSVFGEAAP